MALIVACSSKSSGGGAPFDVDDVSSLLEPDAGSCASPGGPVVGPQDDHCEAPDGGAIVQPTTTAGCYDDAGAPGDDGGGSGDDGGADAGDIGNCGDSDYGPTMYGNWGSDDDCKYDVMWTSTPICENVPVYFTVQVSRRTDNSPVTGANARPDVVLACAHPIPNVPKPRDPSPELAPGVYEVGPVLFDQPGKWVFRFHFNEDCLDIAPDSPHGHAAFYIDVP
ncbi:MAG TPA: hypothetical protein VHS09_07855 [Polyangiaceae bacterium]|nr:hypothetical protein [Polyangiaceae bacterium]